MRSPALLWFQITLLASSLFSGCTEDPDSSIGIEFKDVIIPFCETAVPCMEAHVRMRLADEPRKLDHFLEKMTISECQEAQIMRIQRRRPTEDTEEIRNRYRVCIDSFQDKRCTEVMNQLENNDACKGIASI